MEKDQERKKLVEAVKSPNFEEECKKLGFTICTTGNEATGKKKANI